ncbi:MAG TPA: FkbM family methyltransferase [Chthoniobacterales bacterium]|nr:FkbM family methyltransferase [Chthoniobacterales bacterium]
MIELENIRLHLEPKGDRVGNSDLEFTGWVVADRPIAAVWLPEAKSIRLTTGERPDVRRVFPDRIALGFAGKCPADAIGSNGLRLAVQLGEQIVEVEHPVPGALSKPPFVERIAAALQLGCWRLRERFATDSAARFGWVLRRHLLARSLRGGFFQRHHADALLADFASALPEARFLQIGANDGLTGDPLYPLLQRPGTRWRGVLVEPVAHLFAQLSERHGHNPALRLEQAAIAESNGTTLIHRLAVAPSDSLWLDQIPSLDPGLLRQNAEQFGQMDAAIVREEVSCYTVATLLRHHMMNRLDLLVIDAEGMDWRILRQFDLRELEPQLILYEHQHLTAEARGEAHQFLVHFNYGWAETPEGDTLAWRLP